MFLFKDVTPIHVPFTAFSELFSVFGSDCFSWKLYSPPSRVTLYLKPFLFWRYGVGALEIAARGAINHLVAFPRIIAVSATVNHSFPLTGKSWGSCRSLLSGPACTVQAPAPQNLPHIPWAVQEETRTARPTSSSASAFSLYPSGNFLQNFFLHKSLRNNARYTQPDNWQRDWSGAVGNSQASSAELPAQQHLCSALNLPD